MKLLNLAIALVILSAVFALIERRSVWRRERLLDFVYWFFTPTIGRAVTAIVLFAFVGWTAYRGGAAWFRTQSIPLQAIEVLVASDLIGYATHRLFHRDPLWRIHAIHHSSEALDWLSASRVHPLNEAITRVAQVLPLYLLGFDARVLAGAVPLLTLYAIFVHANVSWDYGPLRYVIASPRFHRWHHTAEEEGLNRNFAGLFPWIDVLFGTFYMPSERVPSRFGVAGEPVPETFLAQLAYPFTNRG
jgi:sterol desaturase/sphingolipid hydroxylase (fatty acid hydroxylase superfamily)